MSDKAVCRWGKFIAAIWLVAGLSGCCCLSQHVGVCGTDCAPHVEVLRGSVGIFPGARTFQETLSQRGISSTMTFSEAWRQVADRIAEQHAAGNCQPIVLVGYSAGAEASINIANDLKERGMMVDAIIILEGNHHQLIPQNVGYCFNAFKPSCIPCVRGLPVNAECGETVLINYDLVANDPSGHMAGEHHLSLASDECVHALLADQVAMILNSRNCYPAEESLPQSEPAAKAGSRSTAPASVARSR